MPKVQLKQTRVNQEISNYSITNILTKPSRKNKYSVHKKSVPHFVRKHKGSKDRSDIKYFKIIFP